MNTHLECEWLIEKSKDVYICCDTRSENHGKELSIEEIKQPVCKFFHHHEMDFLEDEESIIIQVD